MIKQLRKYDVQTTPFIATKDWHLLNVQHQDLVLCEQYSASVLTPDTFVALEFVDYAFGNPYGIINTECNIALEQQDYDPVIYEEGVSGSGLFYPDDTKNLTGTYKRLIYHQILRAFYNNYHNPLQIFGAERIDFQTAGMQRYLSNYFKIFSLPQQKFGDKIQEGSVLFVDNSFDDNYTVVDDCQGNLIASPNLFSRIQEVRHIENIINDGVSPHECPLPTTGPPEAPIELTVSMSAEISGGAYLLPYMSFLSWSYNSTNEDGFNLYRQITQDHVTWTPWAYFISTGENITASTDSIAVAALTASYYVTAYNTFGESTGSNIVSASLFPMSIPLAPILEPIVSGSSILTWASSSNNHAFFAIERSINGGLTYTQITTSLSTITRSIDANVTTSLAGATYSYRVAAINGIGTSSYSNAESITFTATLPAAPILAPITSGSSILTWTTSSNSQSLFTVQKSTSGANYYEINTVASGVGTFTDTNVSSSLGGNSYWYRVAGINPWGTSSFSNTASITFTEAVPPTPGPPAYCTPPPFQAYILSQSISTAYTIT